MNKTSMVCTMQEASEISGLSCYCLKSLVNNNEIVFVKSGRKTYINKASLINYINGGKIGSAKVSTLNETAENVKRTFPTADEILQRRKANGICVDCKADMAEPGKTRCNACNERHNAQRKERDERRRQQGICIKCGKYPVIIGTNYCEVCTAKQKLSARKNYDDELRQRVDDLEVENALLKSALQAVKDALTTANF